MTFDNFMWITFGIGMLLQTFSLRYLEADVKKLKAAINAK